MFYLQVRYQGRLTYLKSEDTSLVPSLSLMPNADRAWGQVVDGNIEVYVCPGNHYSMSEAPHAHVVGGILATAVGFRYHALYPELHHQLRWYKQRRAVQRFRSGVTLLMHSKRGSDEFRVVLLFIADRYHGYDSPYKVWRKKKKAPLERANQKLVSDQF